MHTNWRYLLLIITSLLYTALTHAKTVTVTVLDTNKEAVQGIAVHLAATDGKQHEVTQADVTVLQEDKKFSPYITIKSTSDNLVFKNLDNITHHIYTVFSKDFAFRLKKNESTAEHQIKQKGTVLMACNIHDWMAGYIYTVESPYFGLTGTNGSISFNVPDDAAFNAVIWHPQLASSDKNKALPISADGTVTISLTEAMAEIPTQDNPETFEFLEDY